MTLPTPRRAPRLLDRLRPFGAGLAALLCVMLVVPVTAQQPVVNLYTTREPGLIQPILVHALRRVGLSLGLGGLFSVFGVTNVIRLIEGGRGGFAYFDVAGMTLGMIGGALFLLGGVMEQADKVQAELDEMI